MATETPVLHLRLPRQRLRKTAAHLLELRNDTTLSPVPRENPLEPSVRIVCISDTHNLQPSLPPGDLLVHAGDLTEWGTFDELQKQLSWLSSQPHQYKIVIAGNHDLLLDDHFLNRHPERRDSKGRTRHDLDFGSVTYLQDECVTLSFAREKRSLSIYGSPWTPRYGTSAFQYPRDDDVWSNRVPASVDILITHGPPAGFNNIKPSAGCSYLRQEVARVKPKLMVFGHIHAARGEQTVTFDAAQSLYDGIVEGSRGWESVLLLAGAVAWAQVQRWCGRESRSTRMINAAVVDGMDKEVALAALSLEL